MDLRKTAIENTEGKGMHAGEDDPILSFTEQF